MKHLKSFNFYNNEVLLRESEDIGEEEVGEEEVGDEREPKNPINWNEVPIDEYPKGVPLTPKMANRYGVGSYQDPTEVELEEDEEELETPPKSYDPSSEQDLPYPYSQIHGHGQPHPQDVGIRRRIQKFPR